MSFTSARRDLALVAGGRGLSVIGDEVALIALLLWASAEGHGPLVVAALVMAAALPQLLMAPVSGTLVDRLPARALIAGASAGMALACAALVPALGVGSVWPVVALVVVLNIGQTIVSPAWTALLPEIVGREHIARGMSVVQTVTAAAALAGPAVGGLLVGVAGTGAALLVDAASFALLAGAVLLLRTDRRPEHGAAREAGAVWRGVRLLAGDPVLRGVVILIGSTVLVLGAVNVAEVFLVTQTLGASPAAYGAIGALFAVGLMTGARLARRDSEDVVLVRRIVMATVLMSIAIAVLGLAPTVWVAAAASVAVGVGNGALNVTGQALLVRRSPADALGRVFAALQGIVGAGMLVATGLGGVLLGVLGTREVVTGCGVLAAVLLVAVYTGLLRAVRRTPSAVDPVSGELVTSSATGGEPS
jgi:MFS family permease